MPRMPRRFPLLSTHSATRHAWFALKVRGLSHRHFQSRPRARYRGSHCDPGRATARVPAHVGKDRPQGHANSAQHAQSDQQATCDPATATTAEAERKAGQLGTAKRPEPRNPGRRAATAGRNAARAADRRECNTARGSDADPGSVRPARTRNRCRRNGKWNRQRR